MTRAQRNTLAICLCLVVAGFGLLAMDYVQTRSAARLALVLARLGPGAPLESYVAEFGQASHRYTEPNDMREWGPSTDESLLATTDLYYFRFSGVPYRFVVVYVDETTQRSVLVTWKGM